MRLVLDIDRAADGRVEGFVHRARAKAAIPFSGLLELVSTLEELLPADERPAAAGNGLGEGQGRAGH